MPQAFYNKEAGIKRLTTETGAGQWGSSLAFAGQFFGLEVKVFMVKVELRSETVPAGADGNLRRDLHRQPEQRRPIPAAPSWRRDPDSPGSLGIAISEAVEVAAKNADTKYSLGSVLNHVLMHQTVIGLEALEQMEMAGYWPDVVIGCTGGGSNFAGSPSRSSARSCARTKAVRVIAVEPAACPTLTRGSYAYDFGDTGHLTPLVKMHTLGSTFIPPGIHAGGLRYHGMAPMVSHLKELGLIEARAVRADSRASRPAVAFARAEGIVPAPEASARDPRRHRRGAALQEGRQGADDPVQPLGPRPFRHAGLHRLLRRQAGRPRLRRGGAAGGVGNVAEGGGVKRGCKT